VHITIEQFTEDDAAELQEVFAKTWSVSYEYPPEWRKTRQLSEKDIIEEMKSGYHFFGARDTDGKIMGVYKLHITEEGCFGEHQSILPGYAHEGVASAMYEQFIQYAKRHGYVKIYVNVLEQHAACEHLVEKFGFHKEGSVFEQARGMRVQRYVKWCSETDS
jgi:RimJ/RimL family protein N-acetyltransferase